MKRKTKDHTMSAVIAMLIASVIFLANPVWGLTDILPDLLAWVMIWFALRVFSELNDTMVSARRLSLYLMGISALKLLLWQPVQTSTIRSDSMLATLVFCLVEAGCMLMFFRSFLTGTEELSRRADCKRMYLKVEDMRFLCGLFVVVRAVCNFLPELTAIPDWYVQYGEVLDDELYLVMVELAGAKELLNVICTLPVLIVAAVWLISFLPFLRLFVKDEGMAELFASYLESDDPERRIRRRFSNLHMARICFAVGLVFVFDLQVDAIRMLPICVFPAFFALGCFFMEKFAGKTCFRLPIRCGIFASVVLLLAELYRRFCTVWDLRVYAEVELGTELLLALWAVVGMGLLFCFWLFFAGRMDALSASLGCGALYLSGLPYVILVAFALAQSAIFVLPLTAGAFNFIRLALAAAFWLVINRRFAAFEENVREALSLGLPQRDPEG